MKNDKDIYELKKDFIKRKNDLELKKRILSRQEETLHEICDHSIVFNFKDIKPHKVEISIFVCPACGKRVKKIYNELNELSFEKSQVITIKDQNLCHLNEICTDIQNEVFANYDYYYDLNLQPTIKANTINKILEKDEEIKEYKKTLF